MSQMGDGYQEEGKRCQDTVSRVGLLPRRVNWALLLRRQVK
jgi:hypothetical protein